MDKISIVIPCYNEEDSLDYLYAALQNVAGEMGQQGFEFIFINDGSLDNTLAKIKQLREDDNRVRYISFSRNFGKEAAILAGLKAASGDYTALIDADLQDPPSLLPEMYRCIKKRWV